MNPPLCGLMLGVVIGTTPLAHYLLKGMPTTILLSDLGLELSAATALARSFMELAEMFGDTALPIQVQ